VLSDVCGVAPGSDGSGKGVWFELNVDPSQQGST
jgi:hypothetical protein